MKAYEISADNLILSKVRYTHKDMKLLKSRGLNCVGKSYVAK